MGYVSSGDRVDIYFETGATGGNVLGLLASNVLVMRAPTAEGVPAVLRLNSPQAQMVALAADTGVMWFLLRPAGDAKQPPRRAVTTQQLQQLINSQTRR